MKNKGLLAGVAILTGCFSIAHAEDAVPTATAKPVSNAKAKAVAEVRSSDNAFSLMMESYRQMQAMMIDADFDKRVEVVNTIKDPVQRERVMSIIQQEHDQRIAKLQQTVSGFNSAYGTTRKDAEHRAGVQIASTATPEKAEEQLRQFVPFTPQEFRLATGSQLMPTAAHMIFDDRH